MAQSRRLCVFIGLTLFVGLVIAGAVLWLRGRQQGATPTTSPVSVTPETSLLPTPTFVAAEVPVTPSWPGSAVALLWVVLGGLLALGITLLILRRSRQDTQ